MNIDRGFHKIILAAIALLLMAADLSAERIPQMRMIVVSSQKDAEEILQDLKLGGTFAAIAKVRSMDASSASWGELTARDVKLLMNRFPELALLSEGQTTKVIELEQHRYAIFMRIDLAAYRAGAEAFRKKDFGESEKKLQIHITNNPDAVKARIMLGTIYVLLQMPAKAETQYNEVIKLVPGHREARAGLESLKRRYAKIQPQADVKPEPVTAPLPQPAITSISLKISENPLVPAEILSTEEGLPYSLPLRMIMTGSASEAEEILQEYKKGKPFLLLAHERSQDIKSRLTYGDIGDIDTDTLNPALREELLKIRPGGVSNPVKMSENRYVLMQVKEMRYLHKADRAVSEGEKAEAQTFFMQHIEINPDDLSSRLKLALLYEGDRANAMAEVQYRQAIIFRPEASAPYERLGRLMLSANECFKARELLKKGEQAAGPSKILDTMLQISDVCLIGSGN